MKWHSIEEPRPNATRIRKGFTFIPMEVNGEWRWLEHVYWEEDYTGWETLLTGAVTYRWTPRAWISDPALMKGENDV